MEERFDIAFKWITNLSNLVKVAAAIISGSIFVIGMMAKHDAKQIQKYVDANKPLTKVDVQTIVKEEIAPIIDWQNTHLEETKLQKADFNTLESSYVEGLKIVNRLNGVIKYYEDKAEAEKKAAEQEKKNSMMKYSQIQ